MRGSRSGRAAGALAVSLAVAACGAGAGPHGAPPATTAAASEPEATDPAEEAPAATNDGVDGTLSRDDVDCSAEGLDPDAEFAFSVAYHVVDGELGTACFGEPSDALLDAWDVLATITPPLQLTDLGLFGGFAGGGYGDEDTLAFVNRLDDEGSLFQMSINLAIAEEDPEELALTMAHEFSHVFTATPPELDRAAEASEVCATYYNGEGCYTDDSLMWAWIQTFWGNGLIQQVDPEVDASAADGQERCDVDAGFFGPYAASSPEEDFAESFAAFTFQVDPATSAQQRKIDWMASRPGLAEFRERAAAAGLGPLPNNFESCGESSLGGAGGG